MKYLYCFSLFFILNSQTCSCVLKTVLLEKSVLNYLHPELLERKTLYLIKNEFCNINEKVGGIDIKTINEKSAKRIKNYIRISSVKNIGEFKVITLDYPIEGVVFIVKVDNQDKIFSIDVLEK